MLSPNFNIILILQLNVLNHCCYVTMIINGLSVMQHGWILNQFSEHLMFQSSCLKERYGSSYLPILWLFPDHEDLKKDHTRELYLPLHCLRSVCWSWYCQLLLFPNFKPRARQKKIFFSYTTIFLGGVHVMWSAEYFFQGSWYRYRGP